jgi:hypothetical protein
MMHIAAHGAHSVHGAMAVHMHIYPLGYVQCVQHPERIELGSSKSDLSGIKSGRGSCGSRKRRALVGARLCLLLPPGRWLRSFLRPIRRRSQGLLQLDVQLGQSWTWSVTAVVRDLADIGQQATLVLDRFIGPVRAQTIPEIS